MARLTNEHRTKVIEFYIKEKELVKFDVILCTLSSIETNTKKKPLQELFANLKMNIGDLQNIIKADQNQKFG